MRRMLAIIALLAPCAVDAAEPTPLSTSPLVPLTWDQDPAARVLEAIPSPDCDYALHVQPPNGTSNVWTDGAQELPFSSAPYRNVSFTNFHYDPIQGLFPLVRYGYGVGGGISSYDEVLLQVSGEQLLTFLGDHISEVITGRIVQEVPRPGKLPLYVFTESRRMVELHFVYTRSWAHVPEERFPVAVLEDECITHRPDGTVLRFGVVGGRLGEIVRAYQEPPAVLEPTIAAQGTTIIAAGRSETRSAVVLPLGTNGLRLVSWDASTSESVVLRPDGGGNASVTDPLRLCEPIADGGWLVALKSGDRPLAWVVLGSQAHACPILPPSGQWTLSGWDVDISDPRAPLLCYVVSRSVSGLVYEQVVGAKWNATPTASWTVQPLAEVVRRPASGTSILKPRIGRNAAGIATVCFFSGAVVNAVASGTTYSVALDGAGPRLPVPVTGDNWIVQ